MKHEHLESVGRKVAKETAALHQRYKEEKEHSVKMRNDANKVSVCRVFEPRQGGIRDPNLKPNLTGFSCVRRSAVIVCVSLQVKSERDVLARQSQLLMMDAASDEKIVKLLFEVEQLQSTLSRERLEHAERLRDLQASIPRTCDLGAFARTLNPNRKKQKNKREQSSAHVCVTGNLHRNDRSAEKISEFLFGFRNCIFGFIDRKRFF